MAAKKLGDTIYFKVYAKLPDGTYVYSSLLSTSPKAYAMKMINKTTSSDTLKALCVSLLNYGAAAQEYFNYKPYNLMNAELTEEQKALAAAYDPSMVFSVPSVADKDDAFVRTSAAFKQMSPRVNFGSAFAVDYLMKPAYAVDGKMKFYYWDKETVSSVSQLTVENATASADMVETDGVYSVSLTGITARQINEPLYAAVDYESNGVTYTSGILPYSLGLYCRNFASKEGDPAQALAQATAVYGYYARNYFGA